MKVLIDINHPAHVHLFRNFAREMEESGNRVLFTTRKKDVAVDLLEIRPNVRVPKPEL